MQFISSINDMVYIHMTNPSAWDSKNNKYVTMTEQNKDDKSLNFSKTVTMLIHKDSKDITILKQMIKDLSTGLKRNWNNPLKLYENENNAELHENYYMITFKSKPDFTIRVVDSIKQPFEIQDNENYKGRIIGNLSQYQSGTGGITCYLKAIQVIAKSKIQIGKSITDLFDAVEADEEDELPF